MRHGVKPFTRAARRRPLTLWSHARPPRRLATLALRAPTGTGQSPVQEMKRKHGEDEGRPQDFDLLWQPSVLEKRARRWRQTPSIHAGTLKSRPCLWNPWQASQPYVRHMSGLSCANTRDSHYWPGGAEWHKQGKSIMEVTSGAA